jgi:xylulokinase
VIEPGSSFLTTGTAFCLGTVLDGPRFVRGLMAFPHAVQSSTHYVTTGVVTSGGALMSWLGGILAGNSEATGGETELFAQLDREADAIPAGSEGLVVLPYFMGERAPVWDPLARGVFFGLSLKHGRGHLARSLMEAVAYGLNTILELGRGAGVQYNGNLFLIGGGAGSRVWNQIIASVTGLQTVEVTNPLGSAVGAAMAAGLGTGFFTSPADVTQHLELGTICIPNRRDAEIYRKGYLLYKELYRDLKPRFAGAAAGNGGS